MARSAGHLCGDLTILAILVLGSCRGESHPTSTRSADGIDLRTGNLRPSGLTVTQAVRPGPEDALFLGAGDIARGDDLSGARDTSNLVRQLLARYPRSKVFTAGDNAYPDGSAADFQRFYAPTWGSFKGQTAPTPGNHEYRSGAHRADDYFDYFNGPGSLTGPAGERGNGYYSIDLGGWHVVALNSELLGDALQSQLQWLETDLAAAKGRCTLAYWHRPLFTSGGHGNPGSDLRGDHTRAFWEVLARHGADIVVNGHDHEYERFAPLDPSGSPSSAGLREFVAGTGGGEQRDLWSIQPHSEAQLANRYGILVLTLQPSSYRWAFLGTDGEVYDPGAGDCHPKTPGAGGQP